MFPGQELIKSLEELRLRLENSGVERTNGLLCNVGDDCSYYRKSLDIFLRRDYKDLEVLILRCSKLMEELK